MAALSFYQYDGTGEYSWFTGIHSAEMEGTSKPPFAWAGPILPTSDLHWSQYTGFYIQAALIQGFDVGFLWPYWDDYTHAPKVRVRLTGELGNRGNDYSLFDVNISGQTRPLVSEDNQLKINQTGSYESGLNDYPSFRATLTGENQPPKGTTGLISVSFSGSPFSGGNDWPYLKNIFTGEPVSGTYDYPFFKTVFSGEIIRNESDLMFVTYELSGVLFEAGGSFITISDSDEMDISFNLAKVFFDTR